MVVVHGARASAATFASFSTCGLQERITDSLGQCSSAHFPQVRLSAMQSLRMTEPPSHLPTCCHTLSLQGAEWRRTRYAEPAHGMKHIDSHETTIEFLRPGHRAEGSRQHLSKSIGHRWETWPVDLLRDYSFTTFTSAPDVLDCGAWERP
jgi:hypothetical protein